MAMLLSKLTIRISIYRITSTKLKMEIWRFRNGGATSNGFKPWSCNMSILYSMMTSLQKIFIPRQARKSKPISLLIIFHQLQILASVQILDLVYMRGMNMRMILLCSLHPTLTMMISSLPNQLSHIRFNDCEEVQMMVKRKITSSITTMMNIMTMFVIWDRS